jgi:phosphatidate cytidylyltransferase
LKENLVFNLNRIVVGFFVLLAVIFTYLFKYDYFFLIIINLLIVYDLLKSNLLSKSQLIYYILSFLILYSLMLYAPFFISVYIIIITLLILLTFITNFYINYLFSACILIFSILFSDFLLNHREVLFLIIFISFVNDTSAYIFGNIIKGPLIIPSISPKKTWSGTSISFFISFIILYILGYNIFFSLLASMLLFCGDIYFSIIKRKYNLKDFSNSLSSHGGVLDRVDSIFFILIFFKFFILFNYVS